MSEQISQSAQSSPSERPAPRVIRGGDAALPARLTIPLFLAAREPLKRLIQRASCDDPAEKASLDLIANDLMRTIPWIRLQLPSANSKSAQSGKGGNDRLD